MASFGRWLLGILSGGLSEGVRALANAATNKAVDVGSGSYGAPGMDEDFLKDIESMIKSQTSNPSSPSFLQRDPYSGSFYSTDGSAIGDLLRGWTGSGLTTAQIQANQYNTLERLEAQNFNHNEAVDARMWQQYVEENKYGWNTKSMQEAGLNPAMMYGGGNLVGTAATGATGAVSPQQSTSPGGPGLSLEGLISGIMALARMPLELKQLNADIAESKAAAQKSSDEGWAARYNAITNRMNAGTQKGELGVHERQVAVQEAQVEIQRMLANSDIKVNEEEAKKLAEETLYVADQRAQLPELLAIAEKNATTAQKQALAAMKQANAAAKQAEAAFQNALTNEYLSNYQTDYLYSQRLGQDVINKQNEEIMKLLPEKLQAEVAELKARGYYFDENGKLANKNQALVTAKTIHEYEMLVADVARAVCQVAGTVATGGAGGVLIPGAEGAGRQTLSTALSGNGPLSPIGVTGLQ